MGRGLASFQRRFRDMPEQARAAADPAIVAAANDMPDDMRGLAPKVSGRLAGSVDVTGPGQSTPPHSQPGGSMIVPENAAAITVGNAAVRYAHLVEYGTKRTVAKPFFMIGFALGRKQAAQQIKTALRRAIRGQT